MLHYRTTSQLDRAFDLWCVLYVDSMSSRLGPVNSRPSGRGQTFGRGRRVSGPRSSG